MKKRQLLAKIEADEKYILQLRKSLAQQCEIVLSLQRANQDRIALKSVQYCKSATCTDVSANHADWSCSGCSALLPESDLGHEQVGERFCDICHGEAQR